MCRSRYFNVEYKERHQILSNYSGHPQMQKNVYQRIRKMADAGKPLEFPPIDPKFCLCRDNNAEMGIKVSPQKYYSVYNFLSTYGESCLFHQMSKDFRYLPYTIESTSVAFKGDNFLVSLAYENDIQRMGPVSKFVICNWDPMSCSMTVAQSFDTRLAKKKGKSLLERTKFAYNGLDTEDFEVANSERQVKFPLLKSHKHSHQNPSLPF